MKRKIEQGKTFWRVMEGEAICMQADVLGEEIVCLHFPLMQQSPSKNGIPSRRGWRRSGEKGGFGNAKRQRHSISLSEGERV